MIANFTPGFMRSNQNQAINGVGSRTSIEGSLKGSLNMKFTFQCGVWVKRNYWNGKHLESWNRLEIFMDWTKSSLEVWFFE